MDPVSRADAQQSNSWLAAKNRLRFVAVISLIIATMQLYYGIQIRRDVRYGPNYPFGAW